MKDLRVTKSINQIKFEEVWGKLDSKRKFAQRRIHKISCTNYTFHVKKHMTRKVLFLYFKTLLLVLTKLLILQGGWTLDYPSVKFKEFPDIS